MLMTPHKLAQITGIDRARVTKTLSESGLEPARTKDLGNRKSHEYESADALAVLYQADGALDAVAELARLRAAQATEAELRIAEKNRDLISVQEWQDISEFVAAVIKQSILEMPREAAPHLVGKTELDIEAELDGYCRNALQEITRFDIEQDADSLEQGNRSGVVGTA